MQQVEAMLFAQFGEAFNQLFLQAIELVAAVRQVSGVSLIFQPDPLEEGGLIQRSWRIGVIFQQLRFPYAVPGQIEARIKGRLVGFPRLADKIPGVFGNAEPGHQRVAVDDFLYHFQAHLVQFGGDFFQLINLRERELVVRILTPVRFAVHRVEVKTVFGCFFAPVRALNDTDSFHG